jgi:hypothetical protein
MTGDEIIKKITEAIASYTDDQLEDFNAIIGFRNKENYEYETKEIRMS